MDSALVVQMRDALILVDGRRCDFEALRSRQGQAEAILVAYDIMDGQDVRPEPLEERRKRLARLLKAQAVREASPPTGSSVRRHGRRCPMGGRCRCCRKARQAPSSKACRAC
jgi:hypothetical protein